MSRGNIMYKDKYVLVIYYPAQDCYNLSLSSTMVSGKTRLFLDQRVLDEFSENDVNHLSLKLGFIAPELYVSMSRLDIKRIHTAIRKTKDVYSQGLAEFRKKEDL